MLAARQVVTGIPADQALGLRLMALARVAAAQHMGELGRLPEGAVAVSQAARLAREVRS
jgi:hypothetical protein